MTTETIILAIVTLFAGFIPFLLERTRSKKKESQIQKLTTENIEIEKELEKANKSFPKDLEIIDDASDVLKDRLLPLITKLASKNIEIRIENFGLDLETVMPWINQKILTSEKLKYVNLEMKALIINPESRYLKGLINGRSNISGATINSSIEAANNLINHNLHKFSFEMRKYDLPPIFHGFLLNDEHLFLGFTEIEGGKLVGGTKPYLYLNKKNENISDITLHYFSFFKNWFYYNWNISQEVTNVRK